MGTDVQTPRVKIVIIASFKIAKIKKSLISYSFAVPPALPAIFDESGQESRGVVGPYLIGDRVILKCIVTGGKSACNPISNINIRMVVVPGLYLHHITLLLLVFWEKYNMPLDIDKKEVDIRGVDVKRRTVTIHFYS